MKKIINLILLFVTSIQLASCQNKEEMKTKFEWRETISCPFGYPVDVYRGGLRDNNGNFTSLYLGTHSGNEGWGSSGRSMDNSTKSIPDHLHVIWVSHAENKFYEVDTAIDYDKMLELFNEGYYVPSNGDDPLPRKENYREIIVGFAPGGVVVIWLSGSGRQIEIDRYQGKEVVVPQDEIDRLSPPISNLFEAEYRRKIMYEYSIVPLEVVKANEGKPIPYGIWDSYRKKYNWKLEIELPNEAKVEEVWYNFYNGERYDLFGTTLIEQYPNLIPEHLKWNVIGDKSVPSNINFYWPLHDGYQFNIKFNEQEIYKAFEEVFKTNPNGEATLVIYVNQLNTYAAVHIENGNKKVALIDNEITVY